MSFGTIFESPHESSPLTLLIPKGSLIKTNSAYACQVLPSFPWIPTLIGVFSTVCRQLMPFKLRKVQISFDAISFATAVQTFLTPVLQFVLLRKEVIGVGQGGVWSAPSLLGHVAGDVTAWPWWRRLSLVEAMRATIRVGRLRHLLVSRQAPRWPSAAPYIRTGAPAPTVDYRTRQAGIRLEELRVCKM